MTSPRLLLSGVALVLSLPGCDMLLGDKGKDGESVGYACRVSSKLPEDCMKENPAYTPTSVLTGWKAAEADLTGKKPDGSHADKPADDGADKPEGEESKSAEEKPEGGEGKAPADEHKPPAEEAKH